MSGRSATHLVCGLVEERVLICLLEVLDRVVILQHASRGDREGRQTDFAFNIQIRDPAGISQQTYGLFQTLPLRR